LTLRPALLWCAFSVAGRRSIAPSPSGLLLDINPMTPSARQLLKRVGLRVATFFLGDDAGRFNWGRASEPHQQDLAGLAVCWVESLPAYPERIKFVTKKHHKL
jgi:hypothetical protein